jgi:CRISPR-associated protein Cas4
MHDAIDKKQYSTRKAILQGKSIYCEELGIAGKLDTFDTTSGELVERKALIKDIYEGYKMQLYAEYYCLKEMGYKPTKLAFYSMTDNRKYSLPIPKLPDKKRLAQILDEMRSFTLDDLRKHCCPHCKNSIYNALDW